MVYPFTREQKWPMMLTHAVINAELKFLSTEIIRIVVFSSKVVFSRNCNSRDIKDLFASAAGVSR